MDELSRMDDIVDIAREATEDYLIGELLGRIEVYCEAVSLGCKPMGSLIVRKRHLHYATEHIVHKGCKFLVSELPYGWVDLSIYVLDSVPLIYADLVRLKPGQTSPLFEWAIGKLYGYGDEQVDAHILSLQAPVGDERGRNV
jgi:hypothetical protein